MQALPDLIQTEAQLDDLMSRPSPALVAFMRELSGDILILGAAGKMGPTLTLLAQRAVQAAGVNKKVYAVARRPMPALTAAGVHCLSCDILDAAQMAALPDAENVIYMVGRKFGSTGSEHLTWGTNVLSAYHSAQRYRQSRIVAFSTGCVYPVMHVLSGGATEHTPTDPIGEYAQSCLGRERMFDYFSQTMGTRVLHFRLNYAVELRYGVLVDLAARVWAGEVVDLTTGYANVIWQGDACEQALRSLTLAASPAKPLNVTGPETVSLRDAALEFGRLMGKTPQFTGEENGRGYISNARQANALFGNPSVPVGVLMRWIAA